jgi:mevalonate kinase
LASVTSVPLTVSTPGKLILMGEHAAVYGRPALVAAVDLRLRAHFSSRPELGDGQVDVDLRELSPRRQLAWREILEHAALARERWTEYARNPQAARFHAVWDSDPTHLVQIALGEAAAGFGDDPRPFELRIESELPVGSGFGSSAAAAVAIVAGYRAFRGMPMELSEIGRLALEVERRQHGFPSGIDTAASLYGGLLWACRTALGRLDLEAMAATSPLLGHIQVYDTGPPAEPTGAVVAAVREFTGREPAASQACFDRLEAAARGLRDQLLQATEDPAEVVRLFRSAESCLEELGVVPNPVQTTVRAIEAAGGAAKISGAGSLAGPGGGSLLVYHPRPEELASNPSLRNLRHVPVRLGATGYQLERG